MKGFKLKDGSIWTIIAYNTKEGCEGKTESQISLEDITSFTGVEWDKDFDETHPYKANFSYCFYEHFKINDERISEVVLDVFDLIDD